MTATLILEDMERTKSRPGCGKDDDSDDTPRRFRERINRRKSFSLKVRPWGAAQKSLRELVSFTPFHKKNAIALAMTAFAVLSFWAFLSVSTWMQAQANLFIYANTYLYTAHIHFGYFKFIQIRVLDFCASIVACIKYRQHLQNRPQQSALSNFFGCFLLKFGGRTLLAVLFGSTPDWLLDNAVSPVLILACWVAFSAQQDPFWQSSRSKVCLLILGMIYALRSGHSITVRGTGEVFYDPFHINFEKVGKQFVGLMLAYVLTFHRSFDMFWRFSRYQRAFSLVVLGNIINTSHGICMRGVDKALYAPFQPYVDRFGKSFFVCIAAGTISAAGSGLMTDWLGIMRKCVVIDGYKHAEKRGAMSNIFSIEDKQAVAGLIRCCLLSMLYYALVAANTPWNFSLLDQPAAQAVITALSVLHYFTQAFDPDIDIYSFIWQPVRMLMLIPDCLVAVEIECEKVLSPKASLMNLSPHPSFIIETLKRTASFTPKVKKCKPDQENAKDGRYPSSSEEVGTGTGTGDGFGASKKVRAVAEATRVSVSAISRLLDFHSEPEPAADTGSMGAHTDIDEALEEVVDGVLHGVMDDFEGIQKDTSLNDSKSSSTKESSTADMTSNDDLYSRERSSNSIHCSSLSSARRPSRESSCSNYEDGDGIGGTLRDKGGNEIKITIPVHIDTPGIACSRIRVDDGDDGDDGDDRDDDAENVITGDENIDAMLALAPPVHDGNNLHTSNSAGRNKNIHNGDNVLRQRRTRS